MNKNYMAALNDSEIINSWQINAKPWIKAIDNEEIESCKLITNKAIIDVIIKNKPKSLLDIGCGEGWLERALSSYGIAVDGIDVVPELINQANQQNVGSYNVCAYEKLAAYNFNKLFECIICNFSLIGKGATEEVSKTVPKLLAKNGRVIIQTLHPTTACGEQPYQDGWREGS